MATLVERIGPGLAAGLLGTLLATGCASDGSNASDPSQSPSEPSRSASTSTPTESASTSAPPARMNNCLFSLASVSGVLGGKWRRHVAEDEPCAYTSDRGASFVTDIVNDDIDQGLRDARSACVKGIKPIPIEGRGFVCVEEDRGNTFVIGNIAARGRLWLALIVASSEVPEAELRAMVGLMDTVRR